MASARARSDAWAQRKGSIPRISRRPAGASSSRKTPIPRSAWRSTTCCSFAGSRPGREKERYYREFCWSRRISPRESKQAFLARHGAGPGPADPDKVPYYLLIVGDPETIPFSFQYQLDVQYAVGRIHLIPSRNMPAYARAVVAAESRQITRPPHAVFFGVQEPQTTAPPP